MPRVRRSYIEAASQIVSNRVGDNSKNNYKGKINTMKLYLLHNHDGHGLDAANNLITNKTGRPSGNRLTNR